MRLVCATPFLHRITEGVDMKKAILIITAVLSTIILTACSNGKIVYKTDGASVGEEKKAWTVLVYMCGSDDETVSGAYSEKLNEIMNVKYCDDVNVLVQTGGSAKWHTKGVYSDYTQRFKADNGKLYLADQSMYSSMGEYKTLADFLTWGTSNYKADRYMLVLSGPGGGTMNGLAYDELDQNNSLTLEEIAYAISSCGEKLDMVSFDASLMGSIEVALEMSMCADYMTAPTDVIGSDEWNYKTVLQYLSDYPETDAAELGKAICASYYKRCEQNGTEKDASMSLVDLSGMSTLNQAFDGMAGDMLTATDGLMNYVNLAKAVKTVCIYGGATVDEGFSNLIDVGDMAVKIRDYVGNTADMFVEELNSAVVYRVCGERKENGTGLSVYYPVSQDNDELQAYMQIATGTKYKEFLRKICTQCYVEDVTVTEDFNSSWAWSTYNNDIQAMEYKTILDGNTYELNILGNMDVLDTVDINVYKQDAKSGKYAYIGKYNRLDTDWDGGIFKDNFDGKMLRLCGKNITARLVGKYDGYEIYSAPVVLNGVRSNVRIKHNTEKGNYEIIGAWGGIDTENGRAYGSLKRIKLFDRITPILAVYDKEHKVTEYTTGSTAIKLFGGAEEKNIADGEYILEYELTDVYGQKRNGTPVTATSDGGHLDF